MDVRKVHHNNETRDSLCQCDVLKQSQTTVYAEVKNKEIFVTGGSVFNSYTKSAINTFTHLTYGINQKMSKIF